jgi:SOS-response transcriptional repressor LexA
MKTDKEKINQAIQLLKESSDTGYSISQATGITQASISNYRKGKSKPTVSNANAIIGYYDSISEGERLKNDTNIRYIAPYINEELSKVPYVSALVAATFIENLYSMEYDLETYGVRAEDGEDLTNGEYIVFDVIGESMIPTIPGGAKILCRKIKEEQWEYANSVVVVIYGKTLTVKRVLKNDLYNKNALILKADNPIHGEVTVQRSEIRAMWQAVRIISVKIL